MADIISAVTGNFTSAGTWGTVDTASLLDSEAASTTVSTSNLDSSTFVLPAVALDGLALKLNARSASPTGTFTVTLRNSTTAADARSVTVNVSDLPASGIGWVFFKFSSSVTPNGTDSYLVRVVCSSATSQVTLYRNGTSNNWSRRLRTTTTQAPASGNHIIVCNQLTGAGASTAVTVTMENTATTSFGPTVSGGPPQGIVVSGGGTLTWGVSSSTAYYFKWKGIFLVCGGGTINVGTSGARMPASSSAVLEMDSVAEGDSYLRWDLGGTVNAYGATKTTQTTLTADVAIAATVMPLTDTTGWQVSDQLGFTPTGNSNTTYERKTILTVDSSVQVTLTAGLTNAHSGTTTLVPGYVINLTRNIIIRGVSTTTANHGGIYIAPAGPTVILSYVMLVLDTLSKAVSGGRCVDIQCTTNSVTIEHCSGNPSGTGAGNNTQALSCQGSSLANLTITDFVSYDWVNAHITFPSTPTAATITVTDCFGIRCTEVAMYNFNAANGTFLRNISVGSTVSTGAMVLDLQGASWSIPTNDKFTDNYVFYSGGAGFAFGSVSNGVGIGRLYLLRCKAVRCTGRGFLFNTSVLKLTMDTCDAMGNGNNSAAIPNIAFVGPTKAILISCTVSGDTTFASATGLASDSGLNGANCIVYAFNCSFGVATGIRTAHTTADVGVNYVGQCTLQVYANFCKFASTVVFRNLTNAAQAVAGDHVDLFGSFLRIQDFGQTAGDFRTFAPQGNITKDATVFHTAAPSQKLAPSSSTSKLRSGTKAFRLASGVSKSIKVYVRKSSVSGGDAADYNGNQPRLVVLRNDAVGISADTALATMTVAIGNWEQLSGTISSPTEDGVATVYVDCDGTTGFASCDDWSQ